MTKLIGWKAGCVVLVSCVMASSGAPAQTFQVLTDFDGGNGANPVYVSLAQGTDGKLYGTTQFGGAHHSPLCIGGCGTIFVIAPNGALKTLYSFCPPQPQVLCPDGGGPYAGMVLATDRNFYGTSGSTVFKITPEGKLTTLYTFCANMTYCTDGLLPVGTLIEALDGDFYGTTEYGGTGNGDCNLEGLGCGTVFKISAQGKLTTLYNFCSSEGCPDGTYPVGSLVQATDGNFYGTTYGGGAGGLGTIFRITAAGEFSTFYSFCSQPNCTDGFEPLAGLVQGLDGNFYGTTNLGGTGQGFDCAAGCGTVFQITPAGTLTTLHNFNTVDGDFPGALIQASDGNFYGETEVGGGGPVHFGTGTIYEITPSGVLTTLHVFDVLDGALPLGGLVQATNGDFYATVYGGGFTFALCMGPMSNEGCGTAFSLITGLGPFVAFIQAAGETRATAQILGQGFQGTSEVSFNGVPANFTVRADTFLTAMIPEGATTGYVTVTTPTGVLTSNVPFRVIQ